MNLKNIDEQKEFLQRNLNKINTVVTAMIGARTDLRIVEKTSYGQMYFDLEDDYNYANLCGVMSRAWKEVHINTFHIWWNEDGCEVVLHFSYEHAYGGRNGAEFGRLEVFDDFVRIKGKEN